MESGVLATAGAEIYWQAHGAGPAIVLAHGIGGNHAIWYRQLDALSRSNRVITFDHRGFGLSQDHDGRGRDAFVDDLVALLDHLGEAKVALVGQSMGAGTCIGFAHRAAERVAALAICDSLHGIAESSEVKTIMDDARAKTAAMGQVERVLGAGAPRELAALYRQIASFNAVDRHSLAGSFDARPAADLGGKGFPTLFLSGVDDILFPIEAVRLAQAEVQGSFLVEVNDAGHSAFLEAPVQFNDTILSLLQMAGHVGKAGAAHSNAAGYVAVGGAA
ncbi:MULTISPECIES: alpha/beta fold hydrolase [unclassified Sphingopyxis]|jgi:pimeloyl-ACP methyl ester carboxylesterase|uniref:alpha/beta fold hydrolase n=1 Tax=unclassified Sphingopyxis TaxID=2614943 RepID=UPI0006C61FA7|nr:MULTISPECIES: alpha/beta hydrolase [unclassified Sphingopyxis]USI78017.1 alpha/beta hydrolase [Sphingopyxis sp. USTB-05]GAO79610.1 beta-ketoadipate enol-lactone hydrolase [Sphingopyxis sp. C-1]